MQLHELRTVIRQIISEEFRLNPRLRVFDFDDTLVTSNSRTKVIHSDGSAQYLTPGEYALYDKRPGDKFDYNEFDKVIDPHVIMWTSQILRNVYAKYGPSGAVILTARGRAAKDSLEEFLASIGYPNIDVIALGNSDPSAKADWIAQAIDDEGLKLVEFFDDSHKNVAAVAALQRRFPDVKIIVRHVIHT